MVDGMNNTNREEGNPPGGEISNRLVTIPNLLCLIRLLGSVVLVVLACLDRRDWFLWLFIGLAMTDWIDGKLAILLNQRSVFGARLDSWADAALYTALLFGALWMHGEDLRSEWAWIIPAVATYTLSTLASACSAGGACGRCGWPSPP
jgi:phosphatidylglycerophosphate synthase